MIHEGSKSLSKVSEKARKVREEEKIWKIL